MKRFLVALSVIAVVLGLTQYGPTPYKILDRRIEKGGIVVRIRAEVPPRATKEQLESWCGTITQRESEEVTTIIEFIKTEPFDHTQAQCTAGQVDMVKYIE